MATTALENKLPMTILAHLALETTPTPMIDPLKPPGVLAFMGIK
jgi:hypothetical protein